MNVCGVLLVIFIVLKIIGVINWSWWWVLCPLWASFAILIGFVLIGLVSAVILHWNDFFGSAKKGDK